jgi:hypothetical protein
MNSQVVVYNDVGSSAQDKVRTRMADKWIQNAVPPSHKGLFTRKAKKRGLTAQQFASKIKSGKAKVDSTTLHEALFAANMKKIANKHKKAANA